MVIALLIGVAVLRAGADAAFTQSSGAAGQATPTFRAGTTLIEFTIVATDEKGRPVTDLKPNELTVLENRKPQPIEFFRFEGAGFRPGATAAEEPRESIAPGIFTNRSEYSPGPARNLTAIVIDSVNSRPEDQVAVRAQVMRYLRVLAPNTRIAVYRTGESVSILHDFTDDLESLRARIAKANIEAYQQAEIDVDRIAMDQSARSNERDAQQFDNAMSESAAETMPIARTEMARVAGYYNQQIQDNRADLTLKSLELLGNHLAGIPGRKNLIWITGGIPIITDNSSDRWPRLYDAAIRTTAQRMASQGITIYPVMATGLMPIDMATSSTSAKSSFGQKSELARPTTKQAEMRTWSTLELIAKVTGGRWFRDTNDFTAGVRAADIDMRGTYSLGFYATEAPDNQWHPITVRVNRPGVRVVHREGYLAIGPARQAKDWQADEWQAAVQNPLRSSSLRLDARAETAANNTVNILVQMAMEDLIFHRIKDQVGTEVEIALAERTKVEWTRVRRDRATITLKDGDAGDPNQRVVRLMKSWAIQPETSALRLIVRDRSSGRYGVIDMPMDQLR
jgi:VWFA-related protein